MSASKPRGDPVSAEPARSARFALLREQAGVPIASCIVVDRPGLADHVSNTRGSSREAAVDAIIIGGGIGGLTLALALHRAGIACRVYEAAPEIKPIGVGINLLPHAMLELAGLGLEATLAARGVVASESVFFNRFGQLIYREALGRTAGYAWPQISIHRGDLQAVLIEACRERLGSDRLMLGWLCTGAAQDERGATARFEQTKIGRASCRERV